MLEVDALSLVEEPEHHLIFSFVPRDDGNEEFMKHLDGRLKIVKIGPSEAER